MSGGFSFQMLGPAGARQRLEELRAKVESFRPPTPPSTSAEFGSALTALSGQITPSGTEGFRPMSISGLGLESNANSGLRQLARRSAQDAGVDADLFEALISAESGFNPTVKSRAGAMGLSQLMPDTAKSLGVNDPFDPAQNLRGGATYLRQMLDRFGDEKLALAAYNAGPGRVEQAGNQVPNIAETQRYVQKVLALREGNRS
jgi:soluble lytic murein transglycosylase-like protein